MNNKRNFFFLIKRKKSNRPGVTYFRTQFLWNRETRSDPSWSDETRSGASRSACCRLWSERACRNWTGSALLEATQSGVPSPKRHVFLGKSWSNLSPSDPARRLRAQSPFVVGLAHQVTTSAESTAGDAPMTSLSPVPACVTTSACVREPRRTCVCTFKIFPHARVYACVRNVPLAHKAICMLS